MSERDSGEPRHDQGGVAITLPAQYPKPHRSLSRALLAIIGPAGILPVGVAVAVTVGFFVYVPPEASLKPEAMLFLQGSTDMGGGCLFAGTMALYVVFGLFASVYLAVKLDEHPAAGFLRDFLRALWLLKWHVVAFVVGGLANVSYDGLVRENDFRNMFLLAAVLYFLSVALIVWLRQTSLKLSGRVLLAPLWVVAWLVVGADGTTPRAGQLVNSGQDPVIAARGVRHGLMLRWHRACDALLGDIGRSSVNQ